MKKVITIIVIVLNVLFLASCDGATETLSATSKYDSAESVEIINLNTGQQSHTVPFRPLDELDVMVESVEDSYETTYYGEEIVKETELVETTSVTDTQRSETQVGDTGSIDFAVYITPYGECYHFDPDCGGKNSRPTLFSMALSSYRPCKKCANG